MWRMRYYLKKDPGQRKAENYSLDLRSPQEAARAVENLLLKPEIGQLDIVAEGHEHEREPLKSVELQWVREKDPRYAEMWVGRNDGKKVAVVFTLPGDRPQPQYSLLLGELGPVNMSVRNIASGKQAAQRALTKIVRSLIA